MNRFAGTTAGESRGRAVRAAREAFGPTWKPAGVAIAPGRLELLGNHVDYNGGPVLAAAIDRVVAIVVDERGRPNEVTAVAGDVSPKLLQVAIGDSEDWRSPGGEPDPEAYLRGAVAAL